MTRRKKVSITAVVRNMTYAHSGSPEDARITLDGKLSAQGFPLSRTNKMIVPASAPTPDPQTGELVMRNNHVPFIPENTVRNRLRNVLLALLYEQMREAGQAIDVPCYATLKSGSATGNPDGVPATFDESYRMRRHFFIGLFGGGPRMLQGRLQCDGFIPLVPSAQRILPSGFENRFIDDRITQIRWIRRVDPISKIDEGDTEIIKDAEAAITAWGLDKVQKKLAKKESDGADDGEKVSRNLDSFTAIELIIPGVDFLSRVRLESPADAQIGAMLVAYENIQTINIGGGFGRGYGEFALQELFLNGEPVLVDGKLSDAVSDYVDAFWDAMSEIDTDTLAEFAASKKK